MEVDLYIKIYIGLRYSPSPLETVSLNSIREDNDSKNKCLDESGTFDNFKF
jgi:hypothetical protein